MDYLSGLNNEQRQAVLKTEGPVCVLAGAGSGKTKVLTTRVYHLIRSGVAPENILAVTFTNKASREMRERVAKMLGREIRSFAFSPDLPLITTFHGLGRILLEGYGKALGLPRHLTIFDRDDSKRVIKKLLEETGVDPKIISPGLILSIISKAKGDGEDRGSFAQKEGEKSFPSRTAKNIWPLYDEALRKEKAVDFDDLLSLSVRLLEEKEEVRGLVQNRFQFIHIDEYQDTNNIQARLARLIAEPQDNVFVVGDADQLVYGWRGANIEHILTFNEVYKNATRLFLNHNYRSTKTIVDAANAVIEKNKKRIPKEARTENEEGTPITLFIAQNAEAEAKEVAKKIKILQQQGVALDAMAVLMRTNFQSRAFEEAFLSQNIPYTLLGTKFLERKEVKDMIAWLTLALSPLRETAYARAVQFPARGIGKVTLGKIIAGRRDELKPGEKNKVLAFENILKELHELAQNTKPSELIAHVVKKSGMEEALKKEGEEGLERLLNIRELAALSSRFDEAPGLDGLSAFLAEVALSGDQDEIDRTEEKQERVMMMTVHAAKGLEFEAVFVVGLEEGLFPHEQVGESERDEEEERRLFYVALTRAKKHVFLSLARVRRIYGTEYLQEPSSFISDIPDSLLTVEEADPSEAIVYY